MGQVMNQEYITMMTLACIDELLEALHETPWKPWKKNQAFSRELFCKELIDAWHFLINLSLAAGMTSDDIHQLYLNKNKINHSRHDEGY